MIEKPEQFYPSGLRKKSQLIHDQWQAYHRAVIEEICREIKTRAKNSSECIEIARLVDIKYIRSISGIQEEK